MLVLFDVDGTLTPSRGRIDPEFKKWLMTEFKHEFRLITGSDPVKTQEQVGIDMWSSCYVYNCAGNHIFDRGTEVYKSTWHLPQDLEQLLLEKLNTSEYKIRTGQHIEHRVGLCNFSVVGRGANPEQRKDYYEWDKLTLERESIARFIRENYPDIDATAGGETGVDIYAKNTGKDQVLPQLLHRAPLHFFGDRQDPEGNDYMLAQAILNNNAGRCYHVKNWQETWQILRELNQ